jgi:hypothetical protein
LTGRPLFFCLGPAIDTFPQRREAWSSVRALLAVGAVALLGCPAPSSGPDAGPVDAGAPVVSCAASVECKQAGFEGVCRAGQCTAAAACADDVECGLAERCRAGRCLFSGCVGDADCPTGKCLPGVYSCAECGKSTDCPEDRPVCDVAKNTCTQCKADADCAEGGPAYCDAARGACVFCTSPSHCPNGLTCGVDGSCHGVALNGPCPQGRSCDVGLICVNFNNFPKCLTPCSLYTPQCGAGQLCLKLTFADSNSLVFDKGEPLGICNAPFAGLKYYREACTRSTTSQSCQPNLDCVPDTAQTAVCRAFCNPNASGTCPPGERCHSFPGDYEDHRYGLCYPDNGFGEPCVRDADCRAGLACAPGDDPSASQSMSGFCRFKAGSAPAMAPCAGQLSADGGAVPPAAVCASGACLGDSQTATPAFFCYGACAVDADCQAGGRSGACDGEFSFTGTNVTALLPGCRPGCQSRAECAAYGPQLTCRTQVKVSYYVPSLHQVCGKQLGAAALGEPCQVNADCREGWCARTDGRGGLRDGQCVQPCAVAADCASDAGAADAGSLPGPIACRDVAFLGSSGYDAVANTADDRHLVARQCAGAACQDDADCVGGARCSPDPSPASPLSLLSLRCLPPARPAVDDGGFSREGGSPCATDVECASGACALLLPQADAGRVCLAPCTGATVCPAGTFCRDGGVSLTTASGLAQSFTACTP